MLTLASQCDIYFLFIFFICVLFALMTDWQRKSLLLMTGTLMGDRPERGLRDPKLELRR